MEWSQWLKRGLGEEDLQAIRQATRTGRPLGSGRFVERLEQELERILAPQKREPKPTLQGEDEDEPPLFG